MNNKEFITALSKRTGRTPSDTMKLIEDFIAAMGFGTFEVKKKMERVSVNPTTGKRYLIPPKLALSFKQSASLKERFNAETDKIEASAEDNVSRQ